MKNDYEIRGDVTAIIIDSPKYGRYETLINTNKLEHVKDFIGTWSLLKDKNSFYVRGRLPSENKKRKTIYLHRFLMNCPDGLYVDHLNHDTLNNIDSNLRIVTTSENMQNRKGAQKNGTSGIRGVSWHKVDKKWQAHLKVMGKPIYLGRFTDIGEAERIVTEARLKHMPYSQAR